MSSDTEQLRFRAPGHLLEQADVLATALGRDRSDILVTALRTYLEQVSRDASLEQEIAAAYYDDEITYEQLTALVGRETTANFRALKRQLDESYADTITEL